MLAKVDSEETLAAELEKFSMYKRIWDRANASEAKDVSIEP